MEFEPTQALTNWYFENLYEQKSREYRKELKKGFTEERIILEEDLRGLENEIQDKCPGYYGTLRYLREGSKNITAIVNKT